MKKLIFTLLFLTFGVAQANEFKMDCSFENGKEIFTAKSTEFDFEDPFEAPFMPTSAYFEGQTPDLYVVQGKAKNNSKSEPFALFVTKKLDLTHYSKAAKYMLSEMLDLETVKTVRIAFPTDLYSSYIYAEVELKDASIVKIAVAGLYYGECK